MADLEEIQAFLIRDFPQCKCTIESIEDHAATIRHRVGHDELRPGGTVSGPVMMTVADVAVYVALLGVIGIVPLAVTTSLNINFLRKPSAERDVIGVCKLLKLGKTLVVGDVHLYSEGNEQPIAHAVVTYSIPPVR